MPALRLRSVLAVFVVLLLAVGAYVALTVGARYLRTSDVSASGDGGRVPEFVYRPPDSVPTTARYGPVGPAALVFAGTDVRNGLTGRLDHPWIAVSSQDGSYRALSAPDLPRAAAGALSVAPDGTHLAWAYDAGVVLYDPVTDEARELDATALGADITATPSIGPFSPDGTRLAYYDGDLRILDVGSGEVAATLTGLDETDARQAVWTPDGKALTYVADGRLVTHDWSSDEVSEVPTTLTDRAALAWDPSGERLAAMQESDGANAVELFDVAASGTLSQTAELSPEGYSQQRLLGFTGADDVAIVSLSRTTGPLEYVVAMSADGADMPAEVTQLPGVGTNWLGARTLAVAAEPLAQGSTDFDEPRWPWSDLSKLVAVTVGAVFLIGVYFTRRRRSRS